MRGFIGGLVMGLVIGVVLAVTAPGSKTSDPSLNTGQSSSRLTNSNNTEKPVKWKLASAFPSEMPLSGSLGLTLIDRLKKISSGKIDVEFHEPGALVPTLDLFEAVASGTVDAGLASSQFWGDKSAAFELFGAVPFGPDIASHLAWFRHHGGQTLYEEIYHRNNIHSLICGVTGAAGAGWFDHPIKELIWTVPTSTTEASTIITQKMKVEINGHDRFAYQDKEYFQIKQPLIHHTSVPGYNIKEKDELEIIQPIIIAYRDAGTGTGTDVTTLHNTVSSTSGTKTILNYLIGTNFIPAVTSSNFPKVGDLVRIESKDTDEATAVRQRNITAQVLSVTSQTNGWNIGLSVEDDQDAIGTGFIVGTGNDDLVNISIIARLQNPKSRCSQLDRDVFVYSFALNPEDHQPSGTCNFSRIESAKFLLDGAGTISNIYAMNYNVLRIMSGMGGLAYAI